MYPGTSSLSDDEDDSDDDDESDEGLYGVGAMKLVGELRPGWVRWRAGLGERLGFTLRTPGTCNTLGAGGATMLSGSGGGAELKGAGSVWGAELKGAEFVGAGLGSGPGLVGVGPREEGSGGAEVGSGGGGAEGKGGGGLEISSLPGALLPLQKRKGQT
jgi:hypothetical protein